MSRRVVTGQLALAEQALGGSPGGGRAVLDRVIERLERSLRVSWLQSGQLAVICWPLCICSFANPQLFVCA
jgi:hypothetical protein